MFLLIYVQNKCRLADNLTIKKMNRYLVKILIGFTFYCNSSYIALCQEIDVTDSKLVFLIEKYIGNIHGNDIYLGSDYRGFSSSIIKHNIGTLISKKDFNGIYKIGLGKVDFELEFKEWFIVKDTLYSIVQKNSKNEVRLQINKYDQNINLFDSITLFSDSIINLKRFSFDFKQIGNQISIIGTTDTKENESFFLILNLNNYQLSTFNFTIDDKQNFSCSDFIFNDKNEFFAVFEGEENTHMTPRGGDDKITLKKLKSILISGSKNGIETTELRSAYENYYVRSYKFNSDNEKLFLGALVFSSTEGMPMIGYQTNDLAFGNAKLENTNILLATELTNPAIWSKKDGNTIINNKLTMHSHFQFLKEIKFVEKGQYIFISEYNYRNGGGAREGGGAATATGGNVSSSSSANPVSSNGVSSSYGYSGGVSGNLIVSKIETLKNQVTWTAITKHRKRILNPEINYKISYFLDLDVNRDKLTFYYSDIPKNFDENGRLKEKYVESFYVSKENSIVKFEIDLSDGKNSLKQFETSLTNNKRHSLSVGCSHIHNQNEIIFLTYRGNNQGLNHIYQIYLRPR